MKSFAVVFLVFSIFVFSTAKLTDEQVAKLSEHRKVCVEQSGAEIGKIDAAKKGQFTDDAKLKNYLVCVAKRIGFIDEAGVLQHLVLRAKIGAVLEDQDVANKLDAACAVQKSSIEETVFDLAKCYYEKNSKQIFF